MEVCSEAIASSLGDELMSIGRGVWQFGRIEPLPAHVRMSFLVQLFFPIGFFCLVILL
jgi:hypothetical protein